MNKSSTYSFTRIPLYPKIASKKSLSFIFLIMGNTIRVLGLPIQEQSFWNGKKHFTLVKSFSQGRDNLFTSVETSSQGRDKLFTSVETFSQVAGSFLPV